MNIIYSKNTTWFKAVLFIAGAYHIIWGFSVIFFPCFWFDLAALSHPNYIQLWQFIGLYEVVFGIGYLMAASNPLRHWRVILMGFVTKLSVVTGFTYFYFRGEEPVVVFNMVVSNHIIWLIPFLIILYNAYRHQFLLDNEMIRMNQLSKDELLEMYVTNKNNSVLDLAKKQPVMLVFLRHFGCTFCKEALYNIRKYRVQIEQQGTKIILVNMQEENKCMEELAKFNLQDIEFIADQESLLYKAFKLRRGTFQQLYGLKVLFRGIYLRLAKAVKTTTSNGTDIYQMPGIFVIYKGAVVKQFIHETAADNPPYVELATI